MSNELDALAHWAITSYAHNRDSEDAMLAPLLTVVGGRMDALTTTGEVEIGDQDIPRLAFLIGYLGYPCDAIYLTATWEVIAIADHGVPTDTPMMVEGPPPIEDMGSAHAAILCWAHELPTGVSTLSMLTRHVNDDGTPRWETVSAGNAAELSAFAPLAEAAHAFDPYPIDSEEMLGREEALAILVEANGMTHDSLFYEPGTLLDAARRYPTTN